MAATRRVRLSLLPGPEITALDTPVLSHRVGLAGLCSDSNSDRWFPPEPAPEALAERREYEDRARAACLGCAVMPECRELALRIEARPGIRSCGIWGGLAPWEREDLIGQRQAITASRGLVVRRG
jgi:hypothetical protein